MACASRCVKVRTSACPLTLTPWPGRFCPSPHPHPSTFTEPSNRAPVFHPPPVQAGTHGAASWLSAVVWPHGGWVLPKACPLLTTQPRPPACRPTGCSQTLTGIQGPCAWITPGLSYHFNLSIFHKLCVKTGPGRSTGKGALAGPGSQFRTHLDTGGADGLCCLGGGV